ncbi:hypothetical protein HPP92_005108 [Vanilla planifolia]|uniref:Uncharacterized protein n=1 Tax=Vanilla planifolia TaxID=51239 RepID=A0A835RRK2_VANPL|nr:hypothetical protein HPP92_005108 [Vanilla planifolia]
MEDQPLCSFQVTSFKCGSFALGISNNHATFDGHGFKSFLDNLAALTRDGPPVISRPPFTDRRLLSVRSPPCICFRHPELVDIEMEASDASPTMLELSSCALDFKLFKLTVNDIASLKRQAATSRRPTSLTSLSPTSGAARSSLLPPSPQAVEPRECSTRWTFGPGCGRRCRWSTRGTLY